MSDKNRKNDNELKIFLNLKANKNCSSEKHFTRGAWFSFDYILGIINTWDKPEVNKTILYHKIMGLRPEIIKNGFIQYKKHLKKSRYKIKN